MPQVTQGMKIARRSLREPQSAPHIPVHVHLGLIKYNSGLRLPRLMVTLQTTCSVTHSRPTQQMESTSAATMNHSKQAQDQMTGWTWRRSGLSLQAMIHSAVYNSAYMYNTMHIIHSTTHKMNRNKEIEILTLVNLTTCSGTMDYFLSTKKKKKKDAHGASWHWILLSVSLEEVQLWGPQQHLIRSGKKINPPIWMYKKLVCQMVMHVTYWVTSGFKTERREGSLNWFPGP